MEIMKDGIDKVRKRHIRKYKVFNGNVALTTKGCKHIFLLL